MAAVLLNASLKERLCKDMLQATLEFTPTFPHCPCDFFLWRQKVVENQKQTSKGKEVEVKFILESFGSIPLCVDEILCIRIMTVQRNSFFFFFFFFLLLSSSSSYAVQLWESFGLLNDNLPFGAILELFCPINNFHPSHVIPDIIFQSGLGSSNTTLYQV
jgi:hypothetical protein